MQPETKNQCPIIMEARELAGSEDCSLLQEPFHKICQYLAE